MGRFSNENRGRGVVDGGSTDGKVASKGHREKGVTKERYGISVPTNQSELKVNPLSSGSPNKQRGNPGRPI